MVNTYDLSTIKMHLFILIVHFRSQESTLFYFMFFNDTCLIFCQFVNISFIGSHPVLAEIAKGLNMDCFDTILAYKNMHTIF